MNRNELIARIVARHPDILDRDNCRRCIDRIQARIVEALQNGDRVEIRGFGSFSVRHYPESSFRNPQNQKKVTVPAHPVLHFKPGKVLIEEINAGSPANRSSG
ncbi:MAG: integration host factor subunit beta [Betaproteobacteria bacterium]|nr:integration host factor subunit beta [Betaproteobacteria bacterium]